MDLIRSLRLLRRYWMLIVACGLLGTGATAVVTATATREYSSSVTLFVSVADRGMNASSAYQASLLSQERVKSYADLLKSDRLAERVAAVAGGVDAEALKAKISASLVPDTVLLRASVTDTSPARAKLLADLVGTQLVRLIAEIERPAAGLPALVKATVVDDAREPLRPVRPDVPVDLALGLLAGLAVGVGGGLLRELLDVSVKSPEEIREITGSPQLGLICRHEAVEHHPLITQGPAHSAHAEAFRFLRANLQFADLEEAVRSVVVTGVLPGQGASLTACNLAIALAQAGRRVILADAGLRRPQVAGYFGIASGPGLSGVLTGRGELDDALRPWEELPALSVLPSGRVPANPSALLETPRLGEVMAELRERADLVVIDAPPLLSFADATVLARECDGAILVTKYGATSRHQLRRAAEQLGAVDARLLGTVLNMAPADHDYTHDYSSGRRRRTSAARVLGGSGAG